MKKYILKLAAVAIFLAVTLISAISYLSNPDPSLVDTLAALIFVLPFVFMGQIEKNLDAWLEIISGKK